MIDDALQYLCMLVADTDKLFDAALGMYNLRLALLVAQHSSKVCPLILALLDKASGVEQLTGSARVRSLSAAARRFGDTISATRDR